MERLINTAVALIICLPLATIILKAIFKKSVMFSVSLWAVVFALICWFLSAVVALFGMIHMAWATPLTFGLGSYLFYSINKKLSKPLHVAIENVKAISEGNLSIAVDLSESKTELGILQNSIFHLVNNLKTIISEVQTSANSLSMSGEQLSSMSEELSSGAAEQASSLEELSAMIEELTSTLEANQGKAEMTGTISEQSQLLVTKVASGTNRIIESYKNISDKVNLVNNIAFQTNILALNAAVEAARAGEHGRGFSVVAVEVRRLADSSKSLANDILEVSGSSLKVTEQVEGEITQMLPKISESTQLVRDIVGSTIEQATGISQVNASIQQMNHVTQQNAAASEEMSSSAEELSAQAETLSQLMRYFKI